MPIELRNIYGIGYFNIMIKPIIKLIKNEYYLKEENENERLFVAGIAIKALDSMITYEDDLTKEVKQFVTECSYNNHIPDLIKLEEMLYESYKQRLIKEDGKSIRTAIDKPIKFKLPMTTQIASNSVGHIIDQLLVNLEKENNNKKLKKLKGAY